MGNVGLSAPHCQPFFHSLLILGTLETLVLSSNRLLDGAMVYLSALLHQLPTLTHLNISNIGITQLGLQHLYSAILNDTLSLRHFDVSYNNLGATCGPSLSTFLSVCPHMTNLQLKDTGITSYSLEIGLHDAISNLQKLAYLSLSQNNIDCIGQALSAPSLDLSNTKINGFQWLHRVTQGLCDSVLYSTIYRGQWN